MQDWYTLYRAAKTRQREEEIRAMTIALMKSQKHHHRITRTKNLSKMLNQLGKFLETLGCYLQKRSQTC